MALSGALTVAIYAPVITGDPTSRLCANTQSAALTYLIVNSSSASHGVDYEPSLCFNSFCRAISLLSITAEYLPAGRPVSLTYLANIKLSAGSVVASVS